MANKIQAVVTVAPRAGFHGFHSAQRFFPNGSTEVELDQKEFDAIAADQKLGLPIAVMDALAFHEAAVAKAEGELEAAKSKTPKK